MMSYSKKRIKAFNYAFRGIIDASRSEGPYWIHWAAVVLVSLAGFYFEITAGEWCAVLICFALVICAELLNSAVERLCDAVHPEKDEKIRFVKDAGAGAVLFASVIAAITGCVVFWPYIKKAFFS